MKTPKIHNIMTKCNALWNKSENEDPQLKQEIETTPEEWNLYDTWRNQIEHCIEQGLNFIPIIKGTKQAAVMWKTYQERKATHEEIESWFFKTLAESDFATQFCAFMTHYLRQQLKIEWYNPQKSELTDQTAKTLYEEPWIYREWYKTFPNTPEQFYDLLTSSGFSDFVKKHMAEKTTWGWPKLFNKENPELPNLILLLLHAGKTQDLENYKEALKTCDNLLNETKEFWLAGYPPPLKTKAKDNISIGDIAFAWLIKNADKEEHEKLTTLHVAAMLNMNVATCQRTVMPNIRMLEPLLRLFNAEIAHRGEG